MGGHEALGEDEVHVWLARPPAVTPAALGISALLLSDEERERAARFHFERNQREATVSRALVRTTLARYLGDEPSSFRYRLGPHGRPSLDPPRALDFNATNHPELVACAVARETVGVDLEPLARGDEILEIATSVFSAPERAALAALDVSARRERAVSMWTLKEAYLKARGLGLSAALQDIVIDFPAGGRPTVRLLTGDDEHPSWWLATRDHGGCRIAVAVATAREIALVIRESA